MPNLLYYEGAANKEQAAATEDEHKYCCQFAYRES